MGKRITYHESTSGLSLKDHLIEDYATFRDWILSEHHHSIHEFEERLISKSLENFLIQTQFLHTIGHLSQETVDELTFEYLLSYCDYGTGKGRFELIGPLVSTFRYQKSSGRIHRTNDTELIKLWEILEQGKSISNGKPFISMDEGNVIGFWNRSEIEVLLNKLTNLQAVLKAEDREGIEFVIAALEATNEKSVELIMDIEK